MPELLVFKKNQKLFQLPWDSSLLTVGRSSENDLILTGDLVSRRHAVFEKRDGQFWLVDQSSTGTTCNGRPVIDSVLLKDHSQIGIADWFLTFHEVSPVKDLENQERQTQITRLAALQQTDATQILHFEPSDKIRITRPVLFINDVKTGQRIQKIKTNCIVIGTADDCDVILKDDFVSKKHVELRQSDAGFRVIDLGSTNGTLVRGAQIKECYVREKEEIMIGKSQITIHFEKESESDLVPSTEPVFCGIVGESQAMRLLFNKIQKVAETDMTALVQGETGTGKELVARAIHDLSARRNNPFVVINCGAIAATLIENELFGHERGAFTGADTRRVGAFEQSDQGTLFLDEIGELPLSLQSKVLRVLEYQTLRRLGGQGEIKVNVRIIAATHQNLKSMIARGLFREDLFYRLFVLPLEIPPLRARIEDIGVLAACFLKALSGGQNMTIEEQSIEKLKAHVWPGNVRELKNTMMRALAFCDGVSIKPDDIQIVSMSLADKSFVNPPDVDDADEEQAKKLAQREKKIFERERIVNALAACGGDKGRAAKALGMGRSTLFKKLKEYDIEGDA
ncbi:MAG: sigma 54-interacting transcriptional regulator [Deltaproteobacteria bacterium]|nr:sigma 54-interacting transcriptional regulator [Deltaproteobacteria bacterium]